MTISAMGISLSGMDVEWRRMEVIAENLANINTARTPLGDPYRAQRLVSGPKIRFEDLAAAGAPDGIEVYGVEPVDAQPRRVHEPGNPQADADGFVDYPGIDYSAEMVLMVQTQRAYEANLVALNAARQMYAKAFEIGRR